MRLGACEVVFDFRHGGDLGAGEIEGKGAAMLLANGAVAFDDAARLGVQAGADEAEGELAGKQFVIGEALPGGAAGRDVGGSWGLWMRSSASLKVGQPRALSKAGGQPFVEFGDEVEGLAAELAENFGGEAGGEGIDRFEQGQLVARFGRHDVVGVDHLELVAVSLDAA